MSGIKVFSGCLWLLVLLVPRGFCKSLHLKTFPHKLLLAYLAVNTQGQEPRFIPLSHCLECSPCCVPSWTLTLHHGSFQSLLLPSGFISILMFHVALSLFRPPLLPASDLLKLVFEAHSFKNPSIPSSYSLLLCPIKSVP